ncbi:unnamed protein product [Leptidea sinapis]|uniref:Uncharacterized protein n=1 Tax=Leptidea sinapis TaxID=189913 RepID=A0A5E4R270_9NEOP|nr:unnamed protein product [Leptidea sinapis]
MDNACLLCNDAEELSQWAHQHNSLREPSPTGSGSLAPQRREDGEQYTLTSIPLPGSVSSTVSRLVGGRLGVAAATTATEAPTVSCGLTPEPLNKHNTYVALYFIFQFSRIG